MMFLPYVVEQSDNSPKSDVTFWHSDIAALKYLDAAPGDEPNSALM